MSGIVYLCALDRLLFQQLLLALFGLLLFFLLRSSKGRPLLLQQGLVRFCPELLHRLLVRGLGLPFLHSERILALEVTLIGNILLDSHIQKDIMINCFSG